MHIFCFGLALPQKIESGTFYHSGKTLSAKIAYKVHVKLFEKDNVYKESLPVKVNIY